MERRKKVRTRRTAEVALQIVTASGHQIPGALIDVSDIGLSVDIGQPLTVGATVLINANSNGDIPHREAQVRWCSAVNGRYHAGFEYHSSEKGFATDTEVDLYEVLQVNEKADPDLIHRVYRLLAQRYHPDNPESGNAELFKLVTQAYKILSDPEQRARYDVQTRAVRARRWKIFDQPKAAVGKEAEKRKRQGILTLLYTKRATEPDKPSLNLRELEDLLGIPKEHLEFTLWYLKERGWIARADNARYMITVEGVEQAEAAEVWSPNPDHLLPAAAAS
jgi:hypothetical protein